MAGDPSGVTVTRESLGSAVAAQLIGALDVELAATYPEPGATHFRLDRDEVADGNGAFVVAWRDGVPVGCGAVRIIGPETAELKRMYVVPSARGTGLGRILLTSLEREARALGVTNLLLETGIRQAAALELYARAGFEPIPPFGEYRSSPATSVCMAKTLDA